MEENIKLEKNKKIINIFICIIVILIMIIGSLVYYIMSSKNVEDKIEEEAKIDTSNFTSREIKEYLEEQGYEFTTDTMTNFYTTIYTMIEKESEGITILKIENPLTGIEYSFKNLSCNDEYANISSKAANDEIDEENQYKAFLDWLEDLNLTKLQIINVMDYFQSL